MSRRGCEDLVHNARVGQALPHIPYPCPQFCTLFSQSRRSDSDRVRWIGVLMGIAEADPAQQPLLSAFRQAPRKGLYNCGHREGLNIELSNRRLGEAIPALAQVVPNQEARVVPRRLFGAIITLSPRPCTLPTRAATTRMRNEGYRVRVRVLRRRPLESGERSSS